MIILIPVVLGQIIPPIVDDFALPFSFFLVMLGVHVDQNKYEFDRESGDEEDTKIRDAAMYRCDTQSCAEAYSPLRVSHRLLQLVFALGLLFILISVVDHSVEQESVTVLMSCVLAIVGSSVIVVLVDICGCNVI